MIDTTQGSGWWQATDGTWHPPEHHTSDGSAPRPPRRHRPRSSRRNWLFAPGAGILLVVVLVLAIGASSFRSSGPSTAALTGGITNQYGDGAWHTSAAEPIDTT